MSAIEPRRAWKTIASRRASRASRPASRSRLEAELRVLQARVEDVLVAAGDDAGVGGVAVRDGQERRAQLALGALEREVALVALHRRHQHARRQLQVAGVEPPGHDAGPLDEEHDLLELAARIAPGGARLGGGGVEVGDDPRPAALVVGDHGRRLEGLVVARGRADLRRAAQEAVALADVARDEAVQLEGDGALVDLGDDPPHRAREAQAGALAPAHGLREAQAADHARHHLGHQVVDRAALLADLGEDEAAAVLLVDQQVAHGDPLPAGEALGGAGRRPALVEGRLRRWPPHAPGARRHPVGQAGRDQGEAARRDRQLHPVRGLQAEGGERGGQQPRGLGDDLAAGARRELLAADLDEEVRHAPAPGRGPRARARRAPRGPRACVLARCTRPAR